MKNETVDTAVETEVKVSKDYSKASPEDILRDIARTRAHMDKSLSQLHEKFRPALSRRALRIAGAALLSLVLGIAGFFLYRHFRPKRTAKKWLAKSKVQQANWLDQIILAKDLALAARKGKPSIIVVRP